MTDLKEHVVTTAGIGLKSAKTTFYMSGTALLRPGFLRRARQNKAAAEHKDE
jgi:hypothetical protein